MIRNCVARWVKVSAVIAPIVLCAAAVGSASAAQEGLTAELAVASAGQDAMTMTITAAEGRARMDMTSEQGKVSTVYTEDGMLMIMHARSMYMEFSREMMDSMGKMMGQMGGAIEAKAKEFDPTELSYERSGKTETIGAYDAFEVIVTGAASGETSALWLSEDLDVGLFEVMARMAQPLQSANMPFMGGNSPAGMLQQYEKYAQAQGLPAGRVIRVVSGDGGSMTLASLVEGAIADDVWKAPAGYKKQQMPMMPQH